MNTISNFVLPQFKSGQVLRHSDLNNLADYLDLQDRLTRVVLVGTGIIEGLQPTCEENAAGLLEKVTIGTGIGISSDGYLFFLDQPWELTHYYESSIKAGMLTCSNSNNTPALYELLKEGQLPDIPANGGTAPEVKPLTELDAGEYLVILYFKDLTTQQDRCFSKTEEQAAGVRFDLKALLVKSSDYTLCQDQAETSSEAVQQDNSNENTDPSGPEFLRPYIRRFGFDGTNKKIDLSQIKSFEAFFNNYTAICDPATVVIAEAIDTAFQSSLDLLNQQEPNPFENLNDQLQQLLKKYTEAPAGNTVRYGIQYYYDYLRDLIATHNELVDHVVDLRRRGRLLPDTCLHPRHLSLGTLMAVAGQNAVDPEKCSSPFRSSAFQEENTGKYFKALFLIDRMKALVQINENNAAGANSNAKTLTSSKKIVSPVFVGQFSKMQLALPPGTLPEGPFVNLPVSTESPQIRITPSRAVSAPLSERSVPYYFDADIRTLWNFFLTETGRTAYVLGYQLRTTTAPFDEPLLYEMEAYPFFRIEGHIGMQIADAYEQVYQLKQDLDLPFDIQCVKLSDTLAGISPHELMPGDLRFVYKNAANDIGCMLKALGAPDTLLSVLPPELPDFDQNAFSQEYEEFRANDHNLSEIDCRLPVLIKLSEEYADRRKNFHLFHLFTKQHPGMEHLAGVPKGGTFVLVYADMQDAKATEVSNPVVVGDFALPYYCLADRGGAVFPDTYVAAPPGYFCQNDEKVYELVTYPLGGVLTWDTAPTQGNMATAGAVEPFIVHDTVTGKYYFYPGRITNEAFGTNGRLEILMTYILNGKRSTGKIIVYQTPVVAFGLIENSVSPRYDNDSGKLVSMDVTFNVTQRIPASAKLKWLIAGEPEPDPNLPENATEFPTSFQFSEGQVYEVKLIAENGICRSVAKKSFKLCEADVSLQLLSAGEFPQGSNEPIQVKAIPAGGVFQLIDPDMHVIKPIAQRDSGQDDVYNIQSTIMEKTGDYKLIYNLPQCLQQSSVLLTVTQPPLAIAKSRFCSDDDTNYPIRLTPETGGTFNANAAGVVEKNGQFFFNPSLLEKAEFEKPGETVGLATVNLEFTPPAGTTFTRSLEIFQVPEIEAVTRRPVFASGFIGEQKACLLKGYNIQFRVKPNIWGSYNWKNLETGVQKSGLAVDYDFLFTQGNEFRLKVIGTGGIAPTTGPCPPEKVEVVKILCPSVNVSFNLVKAAQDKVLVLPAPDPDVPTFLFSKSIPGNGVPEFGVSIIVNQPGGIFKIEVENPPASGIFEAAPAGFIVQIAQNNNCEPDKFAYALALNFIDLTASQYRLHYWIEDCTDSISDTVDFFLQEELPVIPLTPTVTPTVTTPTTPTVTPPATPLPIAATGKVAAAPDVLTNRLKEHREILDVLAQDNNIPRSNAFKFAQELLNTGNDLPTLNDNFEKALDAVAKKVAEATNDDLKANYELLADTVVRYYLDRLAAFSPLGIPESAADLLTAKVAEHQDALNFKELAANWQGRELKEKLGATAADDLIAILNQNT